MGSITEQFDASVNLVRALPQKGSMQPSYADAARVYAYYKQARFGECNIAKPSFWDPVGRAKWDAWSNVKGMPKEEAMQRYVDYIKEMFEKFRQTEEFNEKHQDYAHVVEPFCKATGTIKVLEQDKEVRATENNEIRSILKVNGTAGTHSVGKIEQSGVNEEPVHEYTSVSNGHKETKPAVRINGVHKVNSHENEHAALSHNIIENILRSGEESLKSPSDDIVRDSDFMTQSSVEPGYVYLQGSEKKESGEDETSDDSDNEIYCDSLGELPDAVTNSTPKPDIDRQLQTGGNTFSNGQFAGKDASNTMNRQQEAFGDSEVLLHTDLSSLSSGSGYEQVGSLSSFPEDRVGTGLQKISLTKIGKDDQVPIANNDLLFLNDHKGHGGHRYQEHKRGKGKSFNKNVGVRKSDGLNSDDHEQRVWSVATSQDLAFCPEILTRAHSSKGASHGSDDRPRTNEGNRSNGEPDRSHNGHAGRGRRIGDRVQGQNRSGEERPYRKRQSSSSSDSDASGTETIGEKILHCLERLQVDVKGIERRLTSIEQSIKASAVTPAPWWYKYLPSKTVACLILWPLMLNLVLLYMRKRKRK